MQRLMYSEDRQIINYVHWLAVSNAERTPLGVHARRKFADAAKHMHLRLNALALRDFEDPAAFGPPSTWDARTCTGWKKLFLDPAHKDFRSDLDVQEETWKIQEKYLNLFRSARQDRLNRVRLVTEALAHGATGLVGGQPWQPTLEFGPYNKLTLRGPFDDVDDELQPLIEAEAKPKPPAYLQGDPAKMRQMQQEKVKEMRQQMEQRMQQMRNQK
jgi:hypothetical protein